MTERCSTCAINYPPDEHRCHVCQDKLDYFANENPDSDWKEAVERAKATIAARTTLEQVERWRLEQLLDAGYPVDTAEQIARRPAIDLHGAIDLVTNGCPPELAGEILL